jgi:hypothetical protein
MLNRLLVASKAKSPSGFDVYTPETMPERFHLGKSDRIPDIYMVPHNGWGITNRKEHLIDMNGVYHPLVRPSDLFMNSVELESYSQGNHGYDNEDPDMRAIFIAHGPFADAIKSQQKKKRNLQAQERGDGVEPEEDLSTVIDPFDNIEIYNLVAKLLGIEKTKRAPNNGTNEFWERYLGEV